MGKFNFDNWSDAVSAITESWETSLEEHSDTANPQNIYESWERVSDSISTDFDEWNGELVPYEDDMEKLDHYEELVKADVKILFLNWLAQYAISKEAPDEFVEYIQNFWNGDPPDEDIFQNWLKREAELHPTTAQRMKEISSVWYQPKA